MFSMHAAIEQGKDYGWTLKTAEFVVKYVKSVQPTRNTKDV